MKFVLSNIHTPCAWAAGRELTLEEATLLLALEMAERSRGEGPADQDFRMEVVREDQEGPSQQPPHLRREGE